MKTRGKTALFWAMCIALLTGTQYSSAGNNYRNFKVSVYTRAYEVRRMADPAWLAHLHE